MKQISSKGKFATCEHFTQRRNSNENG